MKAKLFYYTSFCIHYWHLSLKIKMHFRQLPVLVILTGFIVTKLITRSYFFCGLLCPVALKEPYIEM